MAKNSIMTQNLQFHCFDYKGNQMHKHEEEQCIVFPIASRKETGLAKMFQEATNLYFKFFFSLLSCLIHEFDCNFPAIVEHSPVNKSKSTMTNDIWLAEAPCCRMQLLESEHLKSFLSNNLQICKVTFLVKVGIFNYYKIKQNLSVSRTSIYSSKSRKRKDKKVLK